MRSFFINLYEVIFVYKKVLDKIIEHKISKEVNVVKKKEKAIYGFNDKYFDYFGCKVFAMPLPGVGRQTKDDIKRCMLELVRDLRK